MPRHENPCLSADTRGSTPFQGLSVFDAGVQFQPKVARVAVATIVVFALTGQAHSHGINEITSTLSNHESAAHIKMGMWTKKNARRNVGCSGDPALTCYFPGYPKAASGRLRGYGGARRFPAKYFVEKHQTHAAIGFECETRVGIVVGIRIRGRSSPFNAYSKPSPAVIGNAARGDCPQASKNAPSSNR